MYHVSTQGVDESAINVHCYYDYYDYYCYPTFVTCGLSFTSAPTAGVHWLTDAVFPFVIIIASCIWNGQVEADALSRFEDAPLVQFMYLVFTRMPVSYRRRLRSLLLCWCDVFRALINPFTAMTSLENDP